MSETFKLHGTISISKEDAIKALDDTSQKAEDTRSNLEAVFDKIAGYAEIAGERIGQGLKWGFDQIKQITIEGMNLSGAVEQGVGGAEAVFGEYASIIQEKAAKAYESMGLSAAKYYQEANKMGSLYIGMGYSQAEAVDMTTNAMQRAADVAAIMGIDLEWAMYSVAGMAKGNYMMMDNLGVAMNATTLEAYALSKGMEVSWKEMTKSEQIALAYEMFMERTAYAMGRYTEENNTYTGSINTAKAAWENFISGQMTMDEAFPHIKNAFDIMIGRLEEILPHVVTGLKKFMEMLSPYLPGIVETIAPVLVSAFTELIKGVINNLPAIIEACGPALQEAWPLLLAYFGGKTAVKTASNWVSDFLGKTLGAGAAGKVAGKVAGKAAAGAAGKAAAEVAGGAAGKAAAGSAGSVLFNATTIANSLAPLTPLLPLLAAIVPAVVEDKNREAERVERKKDGMYYAALYDEDYDPRLTQVKRDLLEYYFLPMRDDGVSPEQARTDFFNEYFEFNPETGRYNEGKIKAFADVLREYQDKGWFNYHNFDPGFFSGDQYMYEAYIDALGKLFERIYTENVDNPSYHPFSVDEWYESFDAVKEHLGASVPGINSGVFMGGGVATLATQLTNLNAKLDTVINLQAQGKTIVLNTGALVGGIGGMMDQQLGKMLQMKTRGYS